MPKKKKRRNKNLRGELSAEAFADENSVSVHEMTKAVLYAVCEYCFHGCFERFLVFLRREKEYKQRVRSLEDLLGSVHFHLVA
jgi:hypothetical protein